MMAIFDQLDLGSLTATAQSYNGDRFLQQVPRFDEQNEKRLQHTGQRDYTTNV